MFISYTPMAPTQVREPFHRDGWIYEERGRGSESSASRRDESMSTALSNATIFFMTTS